jgi:Domain of unknown function (DUF222)
MSLLVQELKGSMERLLQADSFSYSDAGSIAQLQCLRAQFDCVMARAVVNFEESKEWAVDEATDVSAWLATRCHLPRSEARAQLRRGRALDRVPASAAAWAQGAIGTAQFDALVRAQATGPEADFARVEERLVDEAKTLKFNHFQRALDYWLQLADPDGAEEADERRHARRNVSLTPSASGMYTGQMTLDPIPGAIVAGELERLEKILFDADWAEGKARLGREPKVNELCRTPGQRRTDALVEMAMRSRTAPADGRRPEPHFSIVVDYNALHGRICQLSGGQVVAPGTLLSYMKDAWFERVVFTPNKRAECSVTSRFFTGATRRAIELRDLECTHQYCEVPAEQCQIDHIIPYCQGGLTTQENGQVHCPHHNRMRDWRGPPGG